jgi:hypothetical protein
MAGYLQTQRQDRRPDKENRNDPFGDSHCADCETAKLFHWALRDQPVISLSRVVISSNHLTLLG